MYAKCHMNVMYIMHLCPDMSKDFPFVQSDLFTRMSAFECMFTLLKTFFSHEHAMLYVAQAHKHTHAQMLACTHTVRISPNVTVTKCFDSTCTCSVDLYFLFSSPVSICFLSFSDLGIPSHFPTLINTFVNNFS